MSTRAESLNHAAEFISPATEERTRRQGATFSRVPARFADEQIRRLVRQLFCPGWPRPARQVVFSAVDEETDVGGICMQVGQMLAGQVPANVAVVDCRSEGNGEARGRETTRIPCQQVLNNLWRVSPSAEQPGGSALGIRDRLADLRPEFEYLVVHGPPADSCDEVALLGQVSDGVVLVLEANFTRRLAAQRAKEFLLAANVRLLGTVLSGRTFPIPERIYRKL